MTADGKVVLVAGAAHGREPGGQEGAAAPGPEQSPPRAAGMLAGGGRTAV